MHDHLGMSLRGLRQQRRITLPDLAASSSLPLRRLELIEEGIEPTTSEVRKLAERLQCPRALLTQGLPWEWEEPFRRQLADAREALEQGRSAEALSRYRRLADNPHIGSHPRLWQRAELGLALALEAEGDLPAAAERLAYLLQVLAPLDEKLAFEDLTECEHRVNIAIALCRCLREMGDLRRSIAIGEAAFDRELTGGYTDRVVELGATVLVGYMERGELLTCQVLAGQLREAAERLGPVALRAAFWNSATVAAMSGDSEQAVKFGERALAAQALLGDPCSAGQLRTRLAANLLRCAPSAHRRARSMLEQARDDLRHSAATVIDLAYCDLELARCELFAGRAESAGQQAAELATRHPAARNLIAAAEALRAEALHAASNSTAASELLSKVGDQLSVMGIPSRASQAYAAGGDILQDDPAASAAAYQRALDVHGI